MKSFPKRKLCLNLLLDGIILLENMGEYI